MDTVVTNRHIAAPYRGFGKPEICFAYKNQMDIIAQKLNMDPLEFRLRNIYRSTVITRIVAERLGLPYENIEIAPVDTMYTPYEKTTTGSRLTYHIGNAASHSRLSPVQIARRHQVYIDLLKAHDADGLEQAVKNQNFSIPFSRFPPQL
jgi:CO/xanthine dehydrogenase Mo-binding subunit